MQSCVSGPSKARVVVLASLPRSNSVLVHMRYLDLVGVLVTSTLTILLFSKEGSTRLLRGPFAALHFFDIHSLEYQRDVE